MDASAPREEGAPAAGGLPPPRTAEAATRQASRAVALATAGWAVMSYRRVPTPLTRHAAALPARRVRPRAGPEAAGGCSPAAALRGEADGQEAGEAVPEQDEAAGSPLEASAMRAAQERGQGCLPPKKRELPAPASGGDGDEPGRLAERESAAGREALAEWPQATAASKPSRAPSRYSDPGGGGAEAVAGLTVNQYGLLYKVAMPPTTFSPVVNVSPLPPAYGMTSQLLQHQAIYPPIHYTQLPPTPLQFVGSHYSVPYTVPPGFLPSHLLPSSAGLTASHVPQFEPYSPSLLPNDSAPSQATHNFGKTSASISPSLQPHVGGQLLEVSQGQIPIYYQMSRLPAGYSTFETHVLGLNPEQPFRENELDPKRLTVNGMQVSAMGAKESEDERQWPRTSKECAAGAPVQRTEASEPSQPSTPDTDLEVQRVVGVLSSSEYPHCAAKQKDSFSPLNLSHCHAAECEESVRNLVDVTAEKSQWQGLSTKPPQEQLHSWPNLRRLTLVNGKPVLSSLQPAVQEGLAVASPDMPLQERQPDSACAKSQGPLPSHFMKGAIIQLATGELKRVEDLQTQDFVRSAEVSGGLKIDSSTVVGIQDSPWEGFVMLHFVVGEQQSKVSIDVPPEHPFFVYGQGWSSCSPARTVRLFSLPCHKLQVGDVCISISLQSLNGRLAPRASSPSAIQGRPEQGGQTLQEVQTQVGEKGGVPAGSPQQPPSLDPISGHSWAGPSFQKLVEEPRPLLLRPSFIPQEVKLSIEGRSNAGK